MSKRTLPASSHRTIIVVAAAGLILFAPARPRADEPESPASPASPASPESDERRVGLSLFFGDGQMAPIQLVGNPQRFIQEIDIVATAPSSKTDQGIEPVVNGAEMARLDWSGIHQVEEDWRAPGDGTYTRQRFYRGARWMTRRSTFRVVPIGPNGKAIGSPLVADAGTDDKWREDDDGFVRRFVARQTATGCPAINDCTGATYTAQALVQLRDALHPEDRARTIPAATESLRLEWSEDEVNHRTVAVSRIKRRESPTGYGFQITLDPINQPANGQFYQPGETVHIRVTFLDGEGNRLHPPGSLPTYGQFVRGEIASGLRYYDAFRISPTLYYALKHRESNIIVTLSGPSDRVRAGSTVSGNNLFDPVATIATTGVDGWTGMARGLPPFSVSIGGLFYPPLWETPVSDVVSFPIPNDAQPGTYVAAIKARRDFGGEALNRATTIDLQIGSSAKTVFTLKTIACTTCHAQLAGLQHVLHGITDRRACYACHMPLSFEPDSPIDIRVHTIHDRSKRFPGNVHDCLTCHLTQPSQPARGLLP